ncbi:uncharacterized protein LOC128165644 isoform X4 [Crassostrea angulata]|uniref:uncharacterized protein LOC128165644 isoform X4 n=1 Tax=Magallana angulata TaxID=2784310 RepID=UPI0022B0BAED|nr:uncharacterized protein LOC128165644 isoform X4 [Crassostrea angulata]
MKYSCFILVLFAGLEIQVLEGILPRQIRQHYTDSGCHFDSDCHFHHCFSGRVPYCYHGLCHCIGCHSDSDCLSHHCGTGRTTYCHYGQCHCKDSECNTDSECQHHRCSGKETPYCSSGICHCIATTTSFARSTTTPVPQTTTPATTTQTTNLRTTTPEPTTVIPLSSTTCLYHSDCNRHVCQTGHHPYCKFGQHSSECQCTVCTDDSHCSCPVGQVGKCHFDLSLLKYSCTCEHPAESTVTTLPLTTAHTTTTTIPVQPSSQHQPVVSSTTDLPSTFDPTNLVQPSAAQLETNTTRQTTLASTMMQCHVCGDNANGKSCDLRSIYTGNLQQCGQGEDFCMTDLIHDGQAYPKIYKRCVTEEECRNKWLHQTSDLEHCTNYGNVLVEGSFSCHFCCTSDGCNSKQIPSKSTLYIKV